MIHDFNQSLKAYFVYDALWREQMSLGYFEYTCFCFEIRLTYNKVNGTLLCDINEEWQCIATLVDEWYLSLSNKCLGNQYLKKSVKGPLGGNKWFVAVSNWLAYGSQMLDVRFFSCHCLNKLRNMKAGI